MKKTKFLQHLKAARESLGHSQKETGELINMTQTAYCRLEKGKTKISVERSRDIIKILEKHGYKDIPPIELEEIDGVASISFRWPWHKRWLYALIVVVIGMAISFVVNLPGDFARGFEDGQKGQPPANDPSGYIYLALLGGGVIYGLYRLTRKWLL